MLQPSAIGRDYKKDGFHIKWTVENISMRTRSPESNFRTHQPIYSEALECTEWYLGIGSQTQAERTILTCYLGRERVDSGPEVVVVSCQLSFKYPGHQYRLQRYNERGFRRDTTISFELFEEIPNDFRERNSMPTSETFTVFCSVWLSGYEPFSLTGVEKSFLTYSHTDRTGLRESNLPQVLHQAVDNEIRELRRRLCPPPNHCHIVTLIKVDRRSFEMSPKNILNLKEPGRTLTTTVITVEKEVCELALNLLLMEQPDGEKALQVDIYKIKKEETTPCGIFVVCKVSLIDVQRLSVECSCTGQYTFTTRERNEVYHFVTNIREMDFHRLAEGRTVLLFEFAISDGSSISYIKSSNNWSSKTHAIAKKYNSTRHRLPLLTFT